MADRAQNLRQCVMEWQRLLYLDEWSIAIGISSKERMGDQYSRITFNRKEAKALIEIVDAEEVQIMPFGFDAEAEIVKQMLALRYEAINMTGESAIYIERAHIILAKLLTSLHYQSKAYMRMIEEIEPHTELEPEPQLPPVSEKKKAMPRVIEA